MNQQLNWLIHYSEIGLKGKNRIFFERKLINNIKLALKNQGLRKNVNLKRLFGRIILTLPQSKKIPAILANTFGIAWFAKSLLGERKELPEKTKTIAKTKKFQTFAIRANTSITQPKIPAKKIEIEIGEIIRKEFHKKVNLDRPDLTIFVEAIDKKKFAIYTKKQPGLKGLPISSGGKFLSLLSGGIDSPVAAFKIMSRGGKIKFIHFHSYPQTSMESVNKAKEIIRVLKKFQPVTTTLFLIPFLEAQKEIYFKIERKFLVLLYRRLMLKVSQEIAKKYKCQALVTGDSLGQVASQTIENLSIQDSAIRIPILRPLITYHKEEIIQIAQKIGTYLISIKPHQDCCTLFVPKHPIIKAKIREIIQEEKKFDSDKLIKAMIQKRQIIKI